MIGKSFILAGRAVFTVSNGRGDQYTFRVKRGGYSNLYFVSLETSPENYAYIGILFSSTGRIRLTAKRSFYGE